MLSIILLSSCVDLQHINSFAESSLKVSESASGKSSTFTNLYTGYDNAVGSKLIHIKDEELKSNRFDLTQPKVDSAQYLLYRQADKTIDYFANTLSAYFQGISKVSSKDLVNYDFDKVAAGLKADNIKALLHITDAQIDAGAKISKTFADEILSRYRDKKLRAILAEHDEALSASTDALASALQSLKGVITNSKTNLSANYTGISIRPEIAADAKVAWRNNVFDQFAYLDNENAKIDFIIAGLKKIKEGHHRIAVEAQSSRLDAKQLTAILDEYSTKIFETITEIKSLKK